MKSFFAFFKKTWVLSLLGVMLLSLILWFEGPLFAFNGHAPLESSTVRWVLIILFFMIWAGYFIWQFVKVVKANAKLMEGVVKEEKPAQPVNSESAAEVKALTERFQTAISTLKKDKKAARFGGLYQLPWYMFVGAPGTGKTTALTKSGLKFPLSDQMGAHAIGGIGGTRNCDWWFTDEAVLLDTAGRYTTQDSDTEIDKSAWQGFLKLLKKYRRRRPINGVIVAVSATDLLQLGESERKQQALAIRARIKELHEILGIRFPIYVLVTKCDLIAGFVEFFDDMGQEEREQVWGVTFPHAEIEEIDNALAAFPEEFKVLETRLQMRALDRMQRETDTQRRALVYGFPQQFAAIGDPLASFVNEVFQATRFEDRALARGVYFTSGTQEGSPIDRVMGSLAAAFGLDRQVLLPNAASGRSYFIKRLLHDVVFKEAGLAGANLRFEKKLLWLQRGALIGIVLLFLLIAAGLVTSYFRNKHYVADVADRTVQLEKLTHLAPVSGNPVDLLPLLDASRNVPGGYADREKSVPFLMGMGLYQGDKLGSEAQNIYLKLLGETMLPSIVSRLEEQLRRGNANSTDYLYEALRVYLMLGDRKHYDADSVAAWVNYDWDHNLPQDTTDAQRKALGDHLAAMLTSPDVPGSVRIDSDLVKNARQILAQMPLSVRIYHSMKRVIEREGKLPDFSVSNAGGSEAPLVLARRSGQPLTGGVSGFYTLAGYKKFMESRDQALIDVARDSWVLNQQDTLGDISQLKSALNQLYYEDYIRQWDALLADVGVTPFSSLGQGARILNRLAGPESPLKKFMQAAAEQTTLSSVKGVSSITGAVTDAVTGKLDAYRKKLQSALGDAPAQAAVPDKTANPVDAHFDALHKLVGKPGTPAPIDQVIATLKDAAAFMDAADAAKAQGAPAPSGDALAKLKQNADGLPAPLGSVMQSVAGGGSQLVLGDERGRLNSIWTSSAGPFCAQAIAGRYPMVKNTVQEVTQDDFGRFFAPGGMMDDFFQKNLASYVDMSGGVWRWRPVGNVSLGIPQEVLAQFQRAAQIRDAFFPFGAKQVSVRFSLKPVSMSGNLTKFQMDVDGQPFVDAGASSQPASFQWPSGKGSGQVRIDFSPPVITTDGSWALFRMLDKGVLEPTPQHENFKLEFNQDGRKVDLELRASSVINPFRRQMLEQFSCPSHL